MIIDNTKVKYSINKHFKYNKNSDNNGIENIRDLPQSNPEIKDNHNKNDENINLSNLIIDNKKQKDEVLLNIIDITNKYHNDIKNKVSINNIIDEYKLLLYDNKVKNEFAYKIVNLCNKSTNLHLNFKDSESLIQAWNWIKENQKKLEYYKVRNKTENEQYKNLCENIMKEYNLKNIQQLKNFIIKLCQKSDNNDNFLEGIKKILLE